MRSLISIVITLFIIALPGVGAATEYELGENATANFGGYLKNLASVTDNGNDWPTGIRYSYDDSPLLRLNGRLIAFDSLALAVEYETSARFGDQQRLWWESALTGQNTDLIGDFTASPPAVGERGNLLDLEADIDEERNYIWQHRIDRLWVKYMAPLFDIKIGRQALSWGSAYIWNPTDLVNPFSPTDIDTETKSGSDMAVLLVPIGWAGEFAAVWLPYSTVDREQYDEKRSALAARLKYNILEWDVGIMGGQFGEDQVVGFEFSGDLFDAGIYGEGTYTAPGKEVEQDPLLQAMGYTVKEPHDFYRVVIGGTYRWINSFTVFAEYYGNNIGENKTEDVFERLISDQDFAARVERGEIYNFGRNYLGLALSYEFTAKLVGALPSIINLNDASLYLGPNLSYSVVQDFDVTLGSIYTYGSEPSEFGSLPIEVAIPAAGINIDEDYYSPDIYYLYLKYYF
jgi:hypothetical protein